tara:strand:- start:1516 stop:1968 length:453 start_codon:yes stop_codon:yes gene_type:complete
LALCQWLIATLAIVTGLSTASAQSLPSVLSGPRFLPVDQAFNVYTSLPAPGVLAVHWQIAPEYYLYVDKFAFSVLENGEPREFSLSLPEASAHSDEFFGDVQVYFEDMAAQLTFEGEPPHTEIVLLIEYQGCAEAGFCYTLQRREIALVL